MSSTQRYIYIRTDFRIFTWANVNLNARNFRENEKKRNAHMKRVEKKIVKQIMKCFHHNNNFILWMLFITFSSAYGLTVSFGRKENQFVFSWKINFKEHFSTQLETSHTAWDGCYLRRTINFKGLFYQKMFPFSAHPFWLVVSHCLLSLNQSHQKFCTFNSIKRENESK